MLPAGTSVFESNYDLLTKDGGHTLKSQSDVTAFVAGDESTSNFG